MLDQKKPFIIFSVNQTTENENENRNNHKAYAFTFPTVGVAFKSLLGCYKGDCEESFLILDTPENRALALDIAKRHNQQSILFVNADRNAELFFLNINTRQPVGKFVSATNNHALQQDNWTFDPETEIFYTTV